MELCGSLDELRRKRAGHWMPTGDGLFWCHSPQLCGMAFWGRPDREDALAFLRIMDHYDLMERGFDVVLDGSAVDDINPDALAAVLDWLRAHARVVLEYMGSRVAIFPANVTGLALAGIGPALSLRSARIVTDTRAAFRIVRPRDGDALHDEIHALIAQARNLSPVLVSLRGVLNEANGAVKLDEAARAPYTCT